MGSISLFLVLKNRLFYIEPWCTSNASTKGLFSIWVKIGRCEEKTTLSSYTPLNQSYQLQVSKIATFFCHESQKISIFIFQIIFTTPFSSKLSDWVKMHKTVLKGLSVDGLLSPFSASLMHQPMTSDTMSLNF